MLEVKRRHKDVLGSRTLSKMYALYTTGEYVHTNRWKMTDRCAAYTSAAKCLFVRDS